MANIGVTRKSRLLSSAHRPTVPIIFEEMAVPEPSYDVGQYTTTVHDLGKWPRVDIDAMLHQAALERRPITNTMTESLHRARLMGIRVVPDDSLEPNEMVIHVGMAAYSQLASLGGAPEAP